ncbi:MAG: glycosyltransferase family 2 protein [Acidimicrobiales bacterium]|nr:glycosyltransferase family 2 protein [Acidimicrobiales bacterium]
MADQTDTSRDATPSVLAVVVAHEPGAWFEETLDSLATQDYARLSVVVIDSAGDPTLGSRVHAALPSASVVDAPDTVGFSEAANAILDTGVAPAFIVFCHDDVVLASDAIRQLVTEALRSNAGIAGAKLVDWHDPMRLQHVSYVVDRFGVAADIIEPAELDQEQFDAVADVFAVPSACMLVNTQLFATLGGFDPGIPYRGEDIDLCWRAHLAGARVMIVPDARVRHRDDLYGRTGVDDIRRTRARHQLRTVLVTASRPSLLLTLPLLALLTLGEAAVALLAGRLSHVRDVFGAWSWNLRRIGEIRARRRRLRPLIRARHADVRALQETGSVRINAFVRGQIGRRRDDPQFAALIRTGTARIAAIVAALVALFVVFGSRTLVTDGIPAIGEFPSFGDTGALVGEWWDAWRHRDLGSPGTPRSGIAVIGALSWLLGGADGFVRLLWVLGPVVAGLAGAWRLLGVTGSRRAQIGSLVTYAIVPLPWVSIELASISGLYAYAAAPWVLGALLHAQAASPYRSTAGPWRGVVPVGLGLGLTLALTALFAPVAITIVVPVLGGLLVASLLTGQMRGTLRLLAVLGLGAATLILLALPAFLDQVAAGLAWAPFVGGRTDGPTDLALVDIVGFGLGTDGVAILTLALVVPMALPLLVGRSWRFALAVRGWLVALVSWGLVWAASWGALPFALPRPAVLLAPAAAGVALLAGAAVAVAENDMRAAGFGWRQALLPLGVVAAILATLPTLALAESGRWEMPRGDFTDTLPLADPATDGSYRVLWLAAPDHLPAEGHALDDSLAWVLTLDGLPLIGDAGLPADEGAVDLVDGVIRTAVSGETMRLGRTLGAFGIRYVVILDRLAPAPFSATGTPPAPALEEVLSRQLDLQQLEGINSAVSLYVNTEWTSVRAAGAPGFDAGRDDLSDLAVDPLQGTLGVLAGRATELQGRLPETTELYLAQSNDTRWRLVVDGERTGRRHAVGFATVFLADVEGEGDATLSYDTPLWRQGAAVVQVLGFLVAFGALARRRIGGRSEVSA